MLKMALDITSKLYLVLRNLIILCISISVYSTTTQSAELTLDMTSYIYREVDTNDNFFMEDKSAPFLYSVGLRNWGDAKATLNTKSTKSMVLLNSESTCSGVQKICASSTVNPLTLLRPCNSPLCSYL